MGAGAPGAHRDSLIKTHSLSGNRLRNHTLTGQQINLSKLGTVPSATKATSATSATTAKSATSATTANSATTAKSAITATTATSATSATTATTAGNANALGGQPAANFLTKANHVGTNGIVEATGSPTGNTVPLFTSGPFTVTMTCTKTGAGTALTVMASSSQANSVLDHNPVTAANTPIDTGPDIGPTIGFQADDNVNVDFEAPSGAEVIMPVALGVNSLGTDCWANWSGIN